MRQTADYLLAALCLGALGYFASEAMFWSFPPEGITLAGIVQTMLAYALAGGAALSLVLATGCGGWRGAFLGGALMGFAIEGAIVATMYDAFPFQLVWTPLAWHALLSGLAVLAGGLAAARGGVTRQVAAMLAIGAFGGLWSLYWPVERPTLPAPAATLAYLAGTGAVAAGALALLDRRMALLDPPRAVLWSLPVAILAIFLLQAVADPRPARLAWPCMVGLTVWAMHRLGTQGRTTFARPPAAPLHRHALWLLAAVTAAAIAIPAAPALGGVEGNWIIAVLTGAAGFGLWLSLLRSAYLSASSAAPRSSAPS